MSAMINIQCYLREDQQGLDHLAFKLLLVGLLQSHFWLFLASPSSLAYLLISFNPFK
jgi:hypothetical protein